MMYNKPVEQEVTPQGKSGTLEVLVLGAMEMRSNTGKSRGRFQPIEVILSRIDLRSPLAPAA